MSGTDTWRGINFQGACTLSIAVDFLDNPSWQTLQAEGTGDIEDANVFDKDGRAILRAQIRQKNGNELWQPAQLRDVLKAFADYSDPEPTRFQFIYAGREGDPFRERKGFLERLKHEGPGGLTTAEWDILLEIFGDNVVAFLRGAGGRLDLIQRVNRQTVRDSDLLRLQRLLPKHGFGPVDVHVADDIYRDLYVAIADRAEAASEYDRRFSRVHLLKLLRVDGARQNAGATVNPSDSVLFAEERATWHDPLIDQIRKRGHWLVIVRPARFERRRILRVKDLTPILQSATIKLNNWSLPKWVGEGPQPTVGIDSLSQSLNGLFGPEAWCFYQSGQFVYMQGFTQDWVDKDLGRIDEAMWAACGDHYFQLGWAVSLYTGIYTLAARLAQTEPYKSDGICIEVHLVGLDGRYLNDPDKQMAYGKASIPEFPYEACFQASDLITRYTDEALIAAEETFIRFQCPLTVEDLRWRQRPWIPYWPERGA